MAALRTCHGVVKSGSPTPSEITSWPFILATSSKKSRMPLLGSVATWLATQRLLVVLMWILRLGADVETIARAFAAIEQEAAFFVGTQEEMRARRKHAAEGGKFFGHE